MSEKLSAARVQSVMKECLFAHDDEEDERLEVEGVVHKFAFCKEQLEVHRGEIEEMLGEMGDEFSPGHGGGWSFLNACNDRHGVQWGEHVDMEALFVLGIGIGRARWAMTEFKDVLPGGMPYVVIDLSRGATQ